MATAGQVPTYFCFHSKKNDRKLNSLTSNSSISPSNSKSNHSTRFRVRAVKEKTEEIKSSSSSSAEEVTKKYGLEVGLWKIFSSKEEGDEGEKEKKSKGDQAKELLAKYGEHTRPPLLLSP